MTHKKRETRRNKIPDNAQQHSVLDLHFTNSLIQLVVQAFRVFHILLQLSHKDGGTTKSTKALITTAVSGKSYLDVKVHNIFGVIYLQIFRQ